MIALIAVCSFLMPKPTKDIDATILYLRRTPREVARKLKAAAALQGKSLTAYVQDLFRTHVNDLEKKGQLPKEK